MQKYELSDYQWEQIKDFFPPKTSKCGRARRDPRELLNAILWVLRTGSPWCALPKEYGPWHTASNNFKKWSQEGIIEKIFNYFCANFTFQIRSKEIYKNRNQIERFFNRLKQFRRIATRYDKLLLSFLSLVQLTVVFITIPKFPSIV